MVAESSQREGEPERPLPRHDTPWLMSGMVEIPKFSHDPLGIRKVAEEEEAAVPMTAGVGSLIRHGRWPNLQGQSQHWQRRNLRLFFTTGQGQLAPCTKDRG